MVMKSVNTAVKEGIERFDETHRTLSFTSDTTQRGPETLGDTLDAFDGATSDVPQHLTHAA